jgi:hypothetical protein
MSFFEDVELAIVARLEDKLSSLDPKPKIGRGRDLSNVKERSQGDLRVIVAYSGIVGVQEQAATIPHIATLTQSYIVWVVARSAKAHGTQSGTKELADPVLERVLEALMGCRVIKGQEPLRLSPSTVEPAYTDDGFGYFALEFNHRKTVRGGT